VLLFARHSRSRNYKAEFASCRLEAVPLEFGDYHPLKPITVTESKTKKVSRKGSTSSTSSSSSSSVVDPLSSVLDGTDPLSMFAATAETCLNSIVGSDFEPWASKRGEILARYTTTEKLSIAKPGLPHPQCQRRFAPGWRSWMTLRRDPKRSC
uniref:VPS35 endosomal protein-sorting factor-like n=1 Tax=Canis lupus dingo TaxID=286419 RepID=A0A8C0L8P4_CANLU